MGEETMTKPKPLKIINEEINDIYFIIKQLEPLEDYKGTDYESIVEEITWNKAMLKNRLCTLQEREQLKKVEQ